MDANQQHLDRGALEALDSIFRRMRLLGFSLIYANGGNRPLAGLSADVENRLRQSFDGDPNVDFFVKSIMTHAQLPGPDTLVPDHKLQSVSSCHKEIDRLRQNLEKLTNDFDETRRKLDQLERFGRHPYSSLLGLLYRRLQAKSPLKNQGII